MPESNLVKDAVKNMDQAEKNLMAVLQDIVKRDKIFQRKDL